MMLSQKVLEGLFKALDIAEEVRTTVRRLRGKPTEPPPWDNWTHSAPTPVPPSADGSDPPVPTTEEPPEKAPTKHKEKRSAKKATSPRKSQPPVANRELSDLLEAIEREEISPPDKDVELDGKALLARIMWAVAQGQSYLGRGLTGAEITKVLSSAGYKTVANNVLRAVRMDDGGYFARGPKHGSASQVVLSTAGLEMAQQKLGITVGSGD